MSTMAEQSLLHRPSGGQVFGTLAASPAARLCWIGALISVAMIYIASFGKMPVHPGFGDGPSIYIASAQSLAQGTGYRLMYYPQAPPAQLYHDQVGETVWLSYKGPVEDLGAEVLAVRVGDDGNGRVIFEGPYNPPVATLFPAQLTDRLTVGSTSQYAWTEYEYTDSFGVIEKPGGRTGKLRGHAILTHTQTANGTTIGDIWTLQIIGAEAGTYAMTLDGGSPATFAYDVGPTTLTGMTITLSYTITSGDFTAHTLTVDDSGLQPSHTSNPAITLNNGALVFPMLVHLMEAGGAALVCECNSTVKGDPKAKPPVAQQFALSLRNVLDGWYTVTFTDAKTLSTFGPSPKIYWDAAASDVQTALSAALACTVSGEFPDYTVTVTKDNDPYTAATDTSDLRSTQSFAVISGFGDACTGPFGGIDPTTMPGYNPSASHQYLILSSGCATFITPGSC